MALATIPRPLADRLGPEASDALVEVINRAVDDNKKDVIELVEERFARRVAEAVGEIRKDMARDKADIFERMAKDRVEIVDRMAKDKVDVFAQMAKDRVWTRVALSIIIILLIFNVPSVVEPLLRAFGVARRV